MFFFFTVQQNIILPTVKCNVGGIPYYSTVVPLVVRKGISETFDSKHNIKGIINKTVRTHAPPTHHHQQSRNRNNEIKPTKKRGSKELSKRTKTNNKKPGRLA